MPKCVKCGSEVGPFVDPGIGWVCLHHFRRYRVNRDDIRTGEVWDDTRIDVVRQMLTTYLQITPGHGPGHALARDVLAEIEP